jgi:hypothetical protein
MISMDVNKLPYQKKPCKNCPFTKNCMKGWLGEERIKDILSADSFVCHKKTDLQCAGHMIINGDNNLFVRLAKVMKIELGLMGKDMIFESREKCIKHHKH